MSGGGPGGAPGLPRSTENDGKRDGLNGRALDSPTPVGYDRWDTNFGSNAPERERGWKDGTTDLGSTRQSEMRPVRGHDEDSELQQAIQMSLADQTQRKPSEVEGVDDDLQRALAESMVDMQTNSARNTVRDVNFPIGLRNVGNTCYFNSILQALFFLPAFKELILSLDSSSLGLGAEAMDMAVSAGSPDARAEVAVPGALPEKESGDDGARRTAQNKRAPVEFVVQLQKLFSSMALSVKRYVDPTPLLEATEFELGLREQQDAGEFCFFFVNRLLEGIDAGSQVHRADGTLEPGASAASPTDEIRRLFFGEQVQRWTGDSVKEERVEPFNQILLPVGPDCQDVYSSLEEWACPAEGAPYRLESGAEIIVHNETAINTLPAVLMMTLQRTTYDKQQKTTVRNKLPFHFEDKLYIDRFLAKNLDEARQRRAKIKDLRDAVVILTKQQQKILRYCGDDVALPDVFRKMLHFLSSRPDDESFTRMVEPINTVLQETLDELRRIESEIRELQERIEDTFSDMKSCSYSLQAILVHGGREAGSGHYWALARRDGEKQWWKLNDMQVSEVSWDEVLANSVGKDETCFAYSLVYFADDAARFSVLRVPPRIQERIEWENDLFRASQGERGYESARIFVLIVQNYAHRVTQLAAVCATTSSRFPDPALIGTQELLWAAREVGLLKLCLLQESLRRVLGGVSASEEILDRLSQEFEVNAREALDVDSRLEKWTLQYRAYHSVVSHISNALLYAANAQAHSHYYFRALASLASARLVARELTSDELVARYRKPIVLLVRDLMKIVLDRVSFTLPLHPVRETLLRYEIVVEAAVQVFETQPMDVWDDIASSILEFSEHVSRELSPADFRRVESLTDQVACFKSTEQGMRSLKSAVCDYEYRLSSNAEGAYREAMRELQNRKYYHPQNPEWHAVLAVYKLERALLPPALEFVSELEVRQTAPALDRSA